MQPSSEFTHVYPNWPPLGGQSRNRAVVDRENGWPSPTGS